ncbi:hypothetical protein KYB31_09130 [Clostridium felsineum]|uniref:hypothetical protein n=1 Tax=Clostridium felsineum TaxID=36839 RepID=UPI00214DB2B3|nr:hypothetical protein [Clostridium felsineum]MCR3759151.1 hypothetical protein [Clostridium felsineum]
MVNILPQVYNILSQVAPSYYQYPQVLVDAVRNQSNVEQKYFPMISYFDSDHSADQFQDGLNDVDTVEITVDVWERADSSTGELISVYADVDTAMRANKFIRTMFANNFEDDTLINHYTFKYKKILEETPL